MSSHSHGINNDGDHSHIVNNHQHTVALSGTTGGSNASQPFDANGDGLSGDSVGNTHEHDFSVSGATGDTNPGTNTTGDHDHGGETDEDGSGTTSDANPPFLVGNFIILAGA